MSFTKKSKNKILLAMISACLLATLFFLNRHELIDDFKTINNIRKIDIIRNITMFASNYRPFSYSDSFEDILKNPNDIILKYISLPFDYRYGSNLIPLTIACLLTSGDYLELGLGLHSTPLLHKLAAAKNTQVLSIDTTNDWADKFKFYNLTQNHKIYVMNLTQMNEFGLDKKWAVVLVDHLSGENRYLNMIKFSNISQIVLGHDAEKW
jgi:hypothetical protein